MEEIIKMWLHSMHLLLKGHFPFATITVQRETQQNRYTGAHLYERRRARRKIELTRGLNLHPCISE